MKALRDLNGQTVYVNPAEVSQMYDVSRWEMTLHPGARVQLVFRNGKELTVQGSVEGVAQRLREEAD